MATTEKRSCSVSESPMARCASHRGAKWINEIESTYSRRNTHPKYIVNRNNRMSYNRAC